MTCTRMDACAAEAAQQAAFQGLVVEYLATEDEPDKGFVVVLADGPNARLARCLGFVVVPLSDSEGHARVYCGGRHHPCRDLARCLAGRYVAVCRDGKGRSTFHLSEC